MIECNAVETELPVLKNKLIQHLKFIYKEVELSTALETLSDDLISLMALDKTCYQPVCHENHWSEKDIIMITYGDSVMQKSQKPLLTLQHFMDKYLGDSVNSVHILPFFPYSSDDGFSVIDYSSVNESLGDWDEIKVIAKDRRLMSDLVINHCSSRSAWFDNFIKGEGPGHDFFYTASPDDDLSDVVRLERLIYFVKQTQGKVSNMFGVRLVMTKLILTLEIPKY